MESVFLSRLTVHFFRNIERAELEPGNRFNVISGNNGTGKTNLLEAIYFFSALRSFRTTVRRELIGSGVEKAAIEGVFGGAARGLVCEIEVSVTGRRIHVDRKEISDVQQHFSRLPMVLFHPADLVLVQGAPKERRRFMDRALFQANPAYPGWISDYNRALLSRNRMLKDRPRSIETLQPFDVQLARLGARICEARRRFLDTARPLFADAADRIGKGVSANLTYRPNVDGEESDFEQVLRSTFSQDRDRGFTSRGPHSDDVEITVKELSAKRFASQGQQRMAVLALKIAEVNALSSACRRTPVLLLDDISSELDRERNRALFSFLQQTAGQVFITTTHLDHVLLDSDRVDFAIEAGAVAKR